MRGSFARRRDDDARGARARTGGEIEHLAHGEPRRGRLEVREVAHDLMNQRQEHGLHRDVGRRVVERRRPHDHAAEPDFLFHRRGGAVVEARQHAVVRSRLERAIAEHVRGRKIAAPRRLEDFEHRVTVVEIAERSAAPRHAIDRCGQASREELGLVGRQRRMVAGDDEQAAAALDEALQGAARAWRERRVIQHDDRSLVERGRHDAARGGRINVKRRRRADRERLDEEQARVGSIPGVDDHDRHRLTGRQDEVKRVVRRQ